MFPFLKQSDEFDRSVWTVGELTTYIREMFELDYRLQDVEVTGEISNFTRAASGHLYFTLKDATAQIKCVMWRTQAERLRFRPVEGDAVTARGRISVYEVGGIYQLYAERLQPVGRGDLAAAFERLKEELAAEGLFDTDHKQPIPRVPRKIGIVTSTGAAALRDILNVLQRRNPLVSVLIAPTLVQGEMAPLQIVRALKWLDDRDDIDTIIVARGGGSIEDLWAFNDERVARAIYDARHPVISGVGHETDFTITDFVADLRAPTPSAAAELAVIDLSDVRPVIRDYERALRAELDAALAGRREIVRAGTQLLNLLSPRRTIDADRQQVDMLADRMTRALHRVLERSQSRLDITVAGLTVVNPLATLARGFAIVRDDGGNVIRAVTQANPGEGITIQVSDGTFGARVTS
ncbi:MAG: exodeoxyribonuclease VII large subunit [Candidatus Promineofilum sp.]|nr:exodeoxyribonuclease VII large subunit [Promineifilum sp.]MBP9657122.1 exodeoxyribonuclease VII large subunit [Promineifilum sp.]